MPSRDAERFTAGLDLGGTDLKSGLVRPDGTVVAFAKRPSRTQESAEAPFEACLAALEALRAHGPIAAVGCGSPGAIHPETGALVGTTAHLPHWRDVPLRERLEEHVAEPVVVDNDANLAGLAEARVGAARGARAALTLTLGTGIGCGIVIEGRVVHGAFGGAGEIGHLPIGSGETTCPCGVKGCVEPEASAAGLVHRARSLGLEVAHAGDVFAAAAGDVRARALVERMCDRLGACIAIAADLLNPEVVVLAGGGARAGEPLLDGVRRAVLRHGLATHVGGLRIVLGALGETAGVVGAGLAAWEAAGVSGSAAATAPASPRESARRRA